MQTRLEQDISYKAPFQAKLKTDIDDKGIILQYLHVDDKTVKVDLSPKVLRKMADDIEALIKTCPVDKQDYFAKMFREGKFQFGEIKSDPPKVKEWERFDMDQ